MVAVLSFGVLVAAGLFLLISRDPVITSTTELVWAFLFSLIGSVALGLAVGAIVTKELEATLLLMAIVGIQFVVDPDSLLARLLPLFAAERQAAVAVGWGTPSNSLQWSGAVAAVLLVVAVAVSALRAPRPQQK